MNNKTRYFLKSIDWVRNYSVENKGIAVSSKELVIYPEVTGYFIPSLLQWGEKELAISYAVYLCSIQKENGSWYDSKDKDPYVFDTAQILKGLLSIRHLLPEVDNSIIKGCEWLISCVQQDGRLMTPSVDEWDEETGICSELIHLYCLSPLKEAGDIFDKPDYKIVVDKVLQYYKMNYIDEIRNFSLLSHFYAYVMEGLYDLGEIDLCRESMERLEKYRNNHGSIPGLNNVPWICSTGLFQLALVWYKLGDLKKGNTLFYNALKLQNESGGWYGSYPNSFLASLIYRGKKRPFYFADSEISWAVKYFLDSLALKEKLEFEKQAPLFLNQIDEKDGRYLLIKNIIMDMETKRKSQLDICDVGCGKGRYLKNLINDCPNNNYYASDLSESVMANIDFVKEKRIGSMTNIPFPDRCFDVVYACESFEHAISLKAAFFELFRIVKEKGILVIIDKPIEKLGRLKIDEWEQWIDDEDIKSFTKECGGILDIINSVPYENKNDGLFRAWLIKKE